MEQQKVTEMKERSNAQLQADLRHAHEVIDHLAQMNGRLQAELFSVNLKSKKQEQQMLDMVTKQEEEKTLNRQQRRHGNK